MLNKKLNFAAIDIGSNAVRFLIKSVAEGEPPSAMTKTVLIRIPLRLGEDSFRRGVITTFKEKQLMRTVKAFRLLMKVYGVTAYRACATSAMRDASNGERIARKIHNKTGIRLEIIDGQQEARIVYDSHVADLLDREGTYLYVDVGGGSTEISLIADGKLVDSHSFDIGTVRQLTGTVRPDDWQALDRELKVWAGRYGNLQIIGSGGNINKLYRMARASHDNRLEIGRLRALYDELKDKTVEQRMEQYSLNGDRSSCLRSASSTVSCTAFTCGIWSRRRRTCNTGRKERASGFPPAYLRRGRYLGGAIGFRGFPVRCGRQSFAGLRSRIPARRDFRTSFVGLPSCLRSA